jgi:hypothetical protein
MIGKWASLETRFANGIAAGPLPEDPGLGRCYIWMRSVTERGYGKLQDKGRQIYVHRYAWFLAYGEWPTKHLDHRCRNPRCVRIDHLREVTHKQNIENHSGRPNASNKTSRYRGVHLTGGKWIAGFTHNGKHHHVGTFTDEDAAGNAVRLARNECFTHNDADRKEAL